MSKNKSLFEKHKSLIIISVVLVILLFISVGSFNGLVSLEEGVNSQWANVESSYQRRMDLIPNLVATVQGAADFESETQTQIAQLRTQASSVKTQWESATSPEQKIAAANQMEGVLSGFNGLNINVERYPDLKATENFLSLQSQLEGTENRINVERNRYNEVVKQYNTKVRTFPNVIFASLFGFEKKELFESQKGAQNAPNVGDLLNN